MSQGYLIQTDATATVRIEDRSRARESDFKLRDIYSDLDKWRFVPTTPNLDDKTSNCKDHIDAIMHHVIRQVQRASEREGSDLPDRERHDDDDDQDEDGGGPSGGSGLPLTRSRPSSASAPAPTAPQARPLAVPGRAHNNQTGWHGETVFWGPPSFT
eukprot:3899506-Rhodomonas_salina.1